MAVCLNSAMIALYQAFGYIKDIRIYIVIWIINYNVATEIIHMKKTMVALESLAPSKNLASPCPSENLVPF